ncbi:MAG TPA: outer membrane lipoprotein carrier protein LolA [Candidatus Polarisedimenticolaceae bacterium]|nr:outer membrane lipoprotein carrier protein LolA [Candidatus Polarisedimenticolaceae bacterium]
MRRLGSAAAILAFGIAVAPAAAASPAPEALAEVLKRFDVVQGQIRTLSAEFVQTTKNPILKQPLVAKGEFYLTKPDSVLWQYSSPEPMRFVVAHGEYTGYFPERKKAEKRDIRRWSEQLFRFFGLGQGSQELGKFYEITLGDSGRDMPGSYLLVLSPKKRRVRRNVEEVKLWVDAGSLLPVRIDYVGKDGAEREIRFMNTRLNPDLAAGLYNVAIPPDVAVSTGFSGFDASSRTH